VRRTVACTMAGTVSGLIQAQVPRLRDTAQRKHLLTGSAVSYRELQQPAFTELLADQTSIVVPENEMKWQLIHPEPDRFDFVLADALLSFARQHGQKLRGHNLCWHNQMPSWFAQLATAGNAGDLLRRHIAAVAGHFAGHIHSWDVVNEAVKVEDGRTDGLRNSKWLQLLGPDYIGIAYRAASQADPKALLTYNDYDLEQDGLKFDTRRNAVLRLLTSMRDQKIPIQAVGLQSHLRAGAKLPSWAGLHQFIEAVGKLDLAVFVTELDVNDSELTGDVQERDEVVARLYRNYLMNVLQHPSVKVVLTWGLTDRDSWLNSPSRRHEGRLLRALPFDAELKPKPAFYAMVGALSAAPTRG
jgi:endo-1,4-beta-xylanase